MTNAPLYFWHASQNLDILFVSCVFVSLFSIIAIFLCLHSDLSWICPQSYNNFPIYASFSRVLLNLLIKSPIASLSDRYAVRVRRRPRLLAVSLNDRFIVRPFHCLTSNSRRGRLRTRTAVKLLTARSAVFYLSARQRGLSVARRSFRLSQRWRGFFSSGRVE